MSMTRKQLGQLIKTAREAKGLTLRAAADLLEIDKGYYSRIENGEYPLGKHARAVAKLYGLKVDEVEALASTKLPTLRPYLRAKYNLPPEAVAELEQHFKAVSQQYKGRKRGQS